MIMKSTSHAVALAVSLLLPALALPAGAFAQTQTPTGGSPIPPKEKPDAEATRVELHIGQLHAQLHITPAQQAQWDQFAQVMRDNAKDMNQVLEQRASGFASMNAVENMQSYAQIAQQHAQDTQKLATAFQALYGDLSDAQKKNADAVFRAEGDHPMHGKATHGKS
jgi:periplasmic protein CpxP/Spy